MTSAPHEQQLALFEEPAASGPRKGEYAVPTAARRGQCRSCGAPIVWVITVRERAIPLSVATIQTREGQKWALPHFVDCPEAKEWKRQ